MTVDVNQFEWTRKPQSWAISQNEITMVTTPHTDLWQRTYYGFQNDNAPVFQMQTDQTKFTFVVKTCFDSKVRFDQCGIVIYLDSNNWLKASVEYENDRFQHLGSVVTNEGYSDWATTEISAQTNTMWYRLSRRGADYRIESSVDGLEFKQMRICHLTKGEGVIRFGIYACSPENSSFTATFSDLKLGPCLWQAHDGQAPDEPLE